MLAAVFENSFMAKFLEWYTQYNALIIQSLAGVIVVCIFFFIYRLFFSKHAEVEMSGGEASTLSDSSIQKIEAKLSEILDKHEPKATVSAPAGTADAALTQEITQLKAEVEKYKSEIIIKETEISQLKEQVQTAGGTPAPVEPAPVASGGASTEELEALKAKLADYEAQIEKLNSRLSEYEIISDEIADLPRFKKENEDLKAQVASLGAGAAAPVETIDRQPEIDTLNAKVVELNKEIDSLKEQLANAQSASLDAIASSMHSPGEDPSEPPSEDTSASTLMVNQEEIDNLLNNIAPDELSATEPSVDDLTTDSEEDSVKKK